MKNSEIKKLNTMMWIILVVTVVLGFMLAVQTMYYAVNLQRFKALMFLALHIENIIIFSFVYVLHSYVTEEINTRKIRGTFTKK